MPFLLALTAASGVVTMSCANEAQVETDVRPVVGTVLVNALTSYSSPTQVLTSLAPNQVPWEILEESPPASLGSPRARFHQFVVRVHEYSHLGHAGDLKLHFFNDRLMEARFFPQKLAAYKAAVALAVGVNLEGRTEGTVGPTLRVWTATEHSGERYVGFADRRLEAEFSSWIRNNT